jgi:hypothetical protein
VSFEFTNDGDSQIIDLLTVHWVSTEILRDDLDAIAFKWPKRFSIMQMDGTSSLPTLTIVVPLLYHRLRTKANVTLVFNLEVFSAWPESVDDVKMDVAIAYPVDGPLQYVLSYFVPRAGLMIQQEGACARYNHRTITQSRKGYARKAPYLRCPHERLGFGGFLGCQLG